MAILVPEDFPRCRLANDAERAVVDALVHGLSDAWYVISDAGILGSNRDRQIDIVLARPDEAAPQAEW